MSMLLRRLALPTLLIAAAVLQNGLRAEAAEPRPAACDRRILPRADTLSVEAAARSAIGEKPENIHVSEACLIGTATSVTLTTPHGEMTCERLQSTWAKRGGWKCDAPEQRRP
jgi:hypothetical protein